MKEQTRRSSMSRIGLLLSCLSAAAYSSATIADEYCSSAKLYATDIKVSCDQYGVSGMQTLYQSSEFINGLIAVKQPAAARQIEIKTQRDHNEAS